MFWYCLPDSFFCYSLYPETSSRVTLAALGIGFQPKLPTTENPQPTIHNRQPITNYRRNKVCLEDNTERSESNPGRSLGIKTKKGELSGRQYLAGVFSSHFFICFGTVFQTAFFVILYIPRLRPGLLSLRSVLASSQSYLQPKTHNPQSTTDNQ